MKPGNIIYLLFFLLIASLFSSCAIGPIYKPQISAEDSGLNLANKKIVVSKFYKAQTELTYSGDIEIHRILESAKLQDASYHVAAFLAQNNIVARANKDADVASLKDNEIMLSGTIVTRSIPFEENFPFPGIMVVILIGNILPSPAAYKSGIDILFRYELVDSSGNILYSSPDKDYRIYYKDYYIWGRIFNYKKYEERINEKLDKEILDMIIEDVFK